MKDVESDPDFYPDPNLDRYRVGLARVTFEQQLAGFLSTQVITLSTPVGPFWRRSRVDPREVLNWHFEASAGWRHHTGWADGVDKDGSLAANLARNQFPDSGHVLSLEWIDHVERADLWGREWAFM